MSNYCSNCGAELINETKFCPTCGKKVEQQTITNKRLSPEQQSEQQTSTTISSTRKSNKKLIIGILAIVIVAVIVAVIILFLLGGTVTFSGADSRIVGEWEQNLGSGGTFLWKFNSDSNLETGSSGGAMYNVGTWKVNGNQLYLYNNMVRYTYELSNNGNTLTLNMFGNSSGYPMNIVLTKKGHQSPNQTTQTPNLACTTDSATNRVTVAIVDTNVKWSDIVITTDPAATWQVFSNNGNALAQTGNTATITTDVTAGDYISLSGTTGNVRVTMKYTPTNSLMGTWTINV
jgi:hypothetical protein